MMKKINKLLIELFFDNLNLSHYQIKLMNQSYPNDESFELDFNGNRYVEAYDEYVNYFNTYNYLDSGISKPLVSYVDYKNLYPIFCIDCSNQDTSKDKYSTVDAILNLRFSQVIPANIGCTKSSYNCVFLNPTDSNLFQFLPKDFALFLEHF